MNRYRYQRLLVVFSLTFLLAACTARETNPLKLDSYRTGTESELKATQRTIPLDLYRTSLAAQGGKNLARLVEVFQPGTQEGINQYRILGVREGSIYSLLGIENGDVIIAANGFIIQEQKQFWYYLQMLPKLDDAFIELRRGSGPVLYEYKFTK